MRVGSFYVRVYHTGRDSRQDDHTRNRLYQATKQRRYTTDITEERVPTDEPAKFSDEIVTFAHVYGNLVDFKSKTGELSQGHAFCSQDDDFDHRKGMLIALNRALQPLGWKTRFVPGNEETPGEWVLDRRNSRKIKREVEVTTI